MTSDPTWADATKGLRDKLKLASMFGGGFTFSPEGCFNLLHLISEMSCKLDAAILMYEVDDVDAAADQPAG